MDLTHELKAFRNWYAGLSVEELSSNQGLINLIIEIEELFKPFANTCEVQKWQKHNS